MNPKRNQVNQVIRHPNLNRATAVARLESPVTLRILIAPPAALTPQVLNALYILNMSASHANQFVAALRREDDGLAISMLEDGLISGAFIYKSADNDSCPLLCLAVRYERDLVAHALLEHGARFEETINLPSGSALTAAGHAILLGNICQLSICHHLGADMSIVCRMNGSSFSALACAILDMEPDCLAYLLDNVHPARPATLSLSDMTNLCMMTDAAHAKTVIGVFEILNNRGFNFRLLGTTKIDSGGRISLADIVLSYAQKNGRMDLFRYFVKDIGLVSNKCSFSGAESDVQPIAWPPSTKLRNNRAPQLKKLCRKFECAACCGVNATLYCKRCGLVLYCSAKCRKTHWSAGGHKLECKEI